MPNTIPDPISDPLARERALTLHYLETLLQWGEAMMQRNSPAAFEQARLILDTAVKILGTPPGTVEDIDHLASPKTVANFVPQEAPLNPRLLNLYDQVSDRLALLHACMNAKRLRNSHQNKQMSYWGNTPLRNGWQTTIQTCPNEADWCYPHSCYRFVIIIQKAQELAREVQGLGALLLAAYEKGDVAHLESLRTTHEHQIQQLTLAIRQDEVRAAEWRIQGLQILQEIAQTRRRYYANLIEAGLNSGELAHVALTGIAIGTRTAGNISELIAQVMGITPDMWIGTAGIAGSPVNLQQIPMGTKLGGMFSTSARITNSLSEISNISASLSLQDAGFNRRKDDWQHQAQVLDLEIVQIERQILEAKQQKNLALGQLKNQQRQIEQSKEVLDFLRDRFTNQTLYLWLQQETAALYYQMYELALHTARQAEHAFNYERGHTSRKFVPAEAWDNLHEGLLAGEHLNLSLHQMEVAYLNENCREYELTKHLSLRLHFPLAFLQLKVMGYCEIEIPEWMFDLDNPGQYMRRIRTVSLTIPCVVGPYVSVNSRLTLLRSQTRVAPHLIEHPATCCRNDKLKNGYEEAFLDDSRFVKHYGALEAIATSSGQNDSGLFELNFRDERYLPFEFAGAISCWRLELRQENNQFDVDTISDVVLHFNYMAREGGEALRKAAGEVAQCYLPDQGLRFFDIKDDFPELWHRFQTGTTPIVNKIEENISKHPTQPIAEKQQLELRLGRHQFPFSASRPHVTIHTIQILFKAPGAIPSAHHSVQFLANDGHTPMDEKHWKCDFITIHCIASTDWPGHYHGVLQLEEPLGPLNYQSEQHLGTFRWPSDVGQVSELYLFCGYNHNFETKT